MKKNKAMRLASILLVVTLLTTCAISGTFAKYTTADSATDSARVAKWGVQLSVAGPLYGDSYVNGGTKMQAYVNETTDSVSINATDQATADVVAPGTANPDGLKITITGTPEVSSKLSATITSENIFLKAGNYAIMVENNKVTAENIAELAADTEGLYYDNSGTMTKVAATDAFDAGKTYYMLEDAAAVAADYYPVAYSGAGITGAITADSNKLVAAEIAKLLNDGAAVTPTTTGAVSTYTITEKAYTPNVNFATKFAAINGASVSWAWAFEQSQDPADTILGHAAAGVQIYKTADSGATYTAAATTDYNINTQLGINITITQAD